METHGIQNLESDPTELFNFLLHMTEDQRPYYYQLTTSLRIVLGSFCLLILAWGTLMKSFVYNHFRSIKLTERPINIYILFDMILFHFLNTLFVLNYTLIIITGETPASLIRNITGMNVSSHSYCLLFSYTGFFAMAYGSSGSCGLAVFRYGSMQ